MNLWRITTCVALIGMFILCAGCGGSGTINPSKLPASDPASGDPAMSNADPSGGTGAKAYKGPGAVSDADLAPKGGADPAQGGAP